MATPDFLYKYQSLSAHSLAALTNNTIWLAKPKSFNDPFDCAITLDRQKYKESVMHAISVAMERAKSDRLRPEHLQDVWPGDKEAFERFRDSLLKLVQNMGICSFSALPNHLLMWSHYANHHRGFCIGYDCCEGTKFRELAHEVRYEDSVPSLTVADFAPPDNEEALDALWLTKAKCWSYEQEWRVMMNEGDKAYQAPSSVVSVIFGARMPESDRIMVAQALRHQPEIEFKEAILRQGEFLIEIVEA
ncbi:MAG: DUF2971 domain-containing protein [Thermodesulfobacteriota bacterium]|nr:DUF2971 domain-containing protein [Thermodesulfobacteriota bacterium]